MTLVHRVRQSGSVVNSLHSKMVLRISEYKLPVQTDAVHNREDKQTPVSAALPAPLPQADLQESPIALCFEPE